MAARSRLIGGLLLLALLAPSCGKKSGGSSGGPLPGPSSWYSQYRKPTSSNLRAVRAADANTVIVAGDATSIFRSDDGGQSWIQLEHQPVNRGGDIVSMDFVGANLECVGSDSADPTKGRVWTATNGVLDFTTPNAAAAVAAYVSVDVVASDTSYRLRTDRIVEKNVSGSGVSTLPILPAGTWNSIFFFANGDGYAAGNNGLIAKFTAAPSPGSWALQATPPPPAPGPPTNPQYNLTKIVFTDATHGYACGDQTTVLSTVNGGTTWTISNYFSGGVPLRSLSFPVDFNTGWVVGDGAVIAVTTNAGVSWTTQVPPAGFIENYNDVWFVSNTVGYVVGNHGAVLRTIDGGGTWLRAPPGTIDPLAQLNAVDFTNDGAIGLAVGSAGTVLRTLDGGTTWFPQSTPSSADLFGVSIPKTGSNTVAYVCGANGTILKISNLQGVLSWASQGPGGGNTIQSIVFPTGDTTGFACGDGSTLLLTTNGSSWAPPAATPAPAAANWKSVSADLGGFNFYVAGDGGVAAKTGTLGASWTDRSLLTTPVINSFQSPAGAGTLFAGASDGKVWRWISPFWFATTPPDVPKAMSFADTSNGWIVTAQPPFTGGVFSTADAGSNWSHLYVHTKWQLRGVWMSPLVPGLGYVVGDNGTILKTLSGGQ